MKVASDLMSMIALPGEFERVGHEIVQTLTHPHRIEFQLVRDVCINVQLKLELLFPLVLEGQVKGVLFADAGNVFAQEEYFLSFNKFKYDFGFGFRWHSPMGPLRFEWAYPLDTDKMKIGSPEFIFSVGF